jgi:hypothetical protein
MKGTGLLQHAGIKRDGLVLDDDQDFFLHLKNLRTYDSWLSPARAD